MFGIKTAWKATRARMLADEIKKMNSYISGNFSKEQTTDLDKKTIAIYQEAVNDIGNFKYASSKDKLEYASELREFGRKIHRINPITSWANHRISAFLECLTLSGDDASFVVDEIGRVIGESKKSTNN